MIFFWKFFLIILFLKSYLFLPIEEKSTKKPILLNGDAKLNILDSTTYLQRFGYLPGSDEETGALRSEAEYIRAIRRFQHFANIPQTGHLDSATRSAMVRPRCGIPDHLDDQHGRNLRPAEYNLGPSKWQKNWITFRILNYTPDLDFHEVRDAFIRSFHLWSKVTNLSFHEVENGYADIYIQFSSGYHQDGYPFDGPGMVLAHAFFPGEDRGGDMHFDEDELWTARSEKGVNLFSVVAHELGHSIGLAHSNTPGTLMYPWHQGYQRDLSLHYDDIIAVQQLYGAKNVEPRPPASPELITTTLSMKPESSSKSTTKASTKTISTTTTKIQHSTKSSTKFMANPTMTSKNFSQPDPCFSHIDSISIIRGEIFVFIDKWFWRITEKGVVEGYPVEIKRFWYGLPKGLEHIDASLERPHDGKILFFSGKRYWQFQGNQLWPNYPESGRPITDFGLPADLEKIDSAFIWGHNKKVYLISGNMYWRLNESANRVDYGYPRDMNMWGGVPLPIDTAFTNIDGITFFFKGEDFWEFNNARMHIRHSHGRSVGHHWFHCPARHTTNHFLTLRPINEQVKYGFISASSNERSGLISLILLFCYACIYV